MVEKILKFIELAKDIEKEGKQSLVPTLIGPSGVGKTSIVKEIGQRLDLPVVRVLLHSMLQEEVLGLPRVIDNKTVWSIPDWVQDDPAIYFFDELDKVSQEELGVVLTLFAEKRVRNKELHPDSVVISAMQPIASDSWSDETGVALRARCAFFPISSDVGWQYIRQTENVDLPFKNEEIWLPIIESPIPRLCDFAVQLLKRKGEEFLLNFLPKHIADIIKKQYESANLHIIDPNLWAKTIQKKPELLDKCDPYVILNNIGYLFEHCDAPIFFKAWKDALFKTSKDEWEASLQKLYEQTRSLALNKQAPLTILGNSSFSEFVKEFDEFLADIASFLESKNPKKLFEKEEDSDDNRQSA